MANRNFAQSRMYTGHVMPVLLDMNVAIGASGATSALKGPYVTSITRMGAGAYKIILDDKYSKCYSVAAHVSSAVTGSNVNISSGLTLGKSYVITALGTSTAANWRTVGIPANVTAAVGMPFVAITASAGTGTGTVKAIAPSGIQCIETFGDVNSELSPGSTAGAVIFIQCYGATDASTTTLIPTDPPSGSTLQITAMLSNSSVLIGGE